MVRDGRIYIGEYNRNQLIFNIIILLSYIEHFLP